MPPDDIEAMADFLDKDDPAIQRLLRICLRNPQMLTTVRSMLARRCLAAGFDPADPPPFWPIRSLPPGIVNIGRVAQGSVPGPEFCLPKDVANEHVGIFGQSGSGKSFLVMSIIRQLVEGGDVVWILDVEDEFSRLLPLLPSGLLLPIHYADLRINFLEVPGPWVSIQNWLEEFCLLFRENCFLRDGSLNMFVIDIPELLDRKGVTRGGKNWPSLLEVIEFFHAKKLGPKTRNAGYVESLLNRLQSLASNFDQTARIINSSMLEYLAQRSVVFRFPRLAGIPLQFFVSYLLLWLCRYREGASHGDRMHFMFIDEGHMLASEKSRIDIGEGMLCRTFRTARKRGISLVICDQVPDELPQPVLANLACKIVMQLGTSRSMWALQTSMGLSREQADLLPAIEKREAVVHYSLYSKPFKIEVPHLEFPPKPSEDELRGLAQAFLAQSHWTEEGSQVQRELAPKPAPAPDGLSSDALLVFTRVCEHAAETIDERCEALQMDRSREGRGRTELDDRGLIGKEEQSVGRFEFFNLTEKGIAWASEHRLRVHRPKSGSNHEHILSQVERQMGAVSPKWRFQRTSSIGREQGLQPDLLVLAPDGRRLIVEVVCSNVAYDARNIQAEAALPGVDRVIAIAPDARTLAALDKALAKAAASSPGPKGSATIITLFAARCLDSKFDWLSAVAAAGTSLQGKSDAPLFDPEENPNG